MSPSRAARERLGHLTAFDLRPIGELRGPRGPRGGLGQRLEGALPGHAPGPAHRHQAHLARLRRRARTTSSSRSTRAWPSGPACIPPPGCAWWAWSAGPTRASSQGASALDVGSGSGILAVGAALARRRRRSVPLDTDPIAVESTLRERCPQRCHRRCQRGAACPVDGGPFDLVFANLVASLLVQLAVAAGRGRSPGRRHARQWWPPAGLGHLHRP